MQDQHLGAPVHVPAILSHDSVGGFVSHCGWNSTLESVVAGVPMVAWPLYADQSMNRVYLAQEIKVALAVKMSPDGFVTSEALAQTMRELMNGNEGRAVREQSLEMSRRGMAAMEDGGSSRADLFKLTESWTTM
ncbi:UDP-glycosyltransferase 88B1-like protein [Tanacetum coccineum]